MSRVESGEPGCVFKSRLASWEISRFSYGCKHLLFLEDARWPRGGHTPNNVLVEV